MYPNFQQKTTLSVTYCRAPKVYARPIFHRRFKIIAIKTDVFVEIHGSAVVSQEYLDPDPHND